MSTGWYLAGDAPRSPTSENSISALSTCVFSHLTLTVAMGCGHDKGVGAQESGRGRRCFHAEIASSAAC